MMEVAVRSCSEADLALFASLPIGRTVGLYLDKNDSWSVHTLLKPVVEVARPILLEGRFIADQIRRLLRR
jgi:hypothetical protein